ncbi:DUF5776 domain-containing protein [Lentilactobacillus hilgardii]|uniref:DUF5776 domain-containing protein n=2 Tax=Lentilactobacillus hilgardii TaxID=1588 RepID=UPI001CDBF185|nr:DUF5776 domain-containing protein [Lentilactobacillus hilgardii]
MDYKVTILRGGPLSFEITAKADGVQSPVKNVVGNMTQTLTPESPTTLPQIQQAMYLTADGADTVYAGTGNDKDGRATTYISKGVKDLTINIPIKNTSTQDVFLNEAVIFADTNSDGGPAFKIGKSATSTDYLLTPTQLGVPSTDIWAGTEGWPEGLRFNAGASGFYDFKPDGTLTDQQKVNAVGIWGTLKAGADFTLKIPVYISNSDTLKNGAVYPLYYASWNTSGADSGYLNVGTFASNVNGKNATISANTPITASTFNADPASATVAKVTNNKGETVTQEFASKTPGTYNVTLTADGYGDTTFTLTVTNGGGTGGGSTGGNTGTTTVPVTPLTPATNVPTNSSSSSSTTSSSSSTPTTTTKPSTSVGPNIAVKGEAVYATKKIALYKSTSFTKSKRIAWYPKQKRINRPMFVVTGYKRTSNGTLRYKVRDVNHGRKTAGKTGYITASRKYVVPVYYAGVPKSKKITVIAKKGINTYKSANLTGKAKHYKKGVRLTVKKLVKHNLTTRYQLSNGHYVTANKKLIIAGNY